MLPARSLGGRRGSAHDSTQYQATSYRTVAARLRYGLHARATDCADEIVRGRQAGWLRWLLMRFLLVLCTWLVGCGGPSFRHPGAWSSLARRPAGTLRRPLSAEGDTGTSDDARSERRGSRPGGRQRRGWKPRARMRARRFPGRERRKRGRTRCGRRSGTLSPTGAGCTLVSTCRAAGGSTKGPSAEVPCDPAYQKPGGRDLLLDRPGRRDRLLYVCGANVPRRRVTAEACAPSTSSSGLSLCIERSSARLRARRSGFFVPAAWLRADRRAGC